MNRDRGSPPLPVATDDGRPNNLAQEAHYFRRLADALPHLIWVRLPSGELEFTNIAWTHYTGLSAAVPSSEALGRVIHPDDQPRLLALRDASLARGEPYELDIRLLRHDGEYRWHRARNEPMRGPDGRIERWVGSCTDIHTNKKTQAQLDALLDGATVGIALFDRELRYVRVNAAFAAFNGAAVAAHLGRTVDELRPEPSGLDARTLRRVLETGLPETLLPSDETERAWLVNFYPVRVEGAVIGVAAIAFEMTDRVRAEQGYALVRKAIDDAVWDWDLRTNRLRWNEAVYSLFRYRPGEVPDTLEWWAERVHPDDRQAVLAGLERTIAGADERWSAEYRFARGDGTWARVLDRGWIARDQQGKGTRMVGSMFDQTEQRRVEAELTAVLDGSPVGFVVFDREGRYLRVNRALAELNGVPVEAHLGRTPAEILPGMTPEMTELFRRVRDTGEPVSNRPISGPSGTPGRERHFLVSFYPIGVEGATDEIVGAVHEITERKREEQANLLLAEAGRALASSLDIETTLRQVTRLLVPAVGDWCALHLARDDGTFAVPALVHVDPGTEALMRELLPRDAALPAELQRDRPHTVVTRTGCSHIFQDVDALARSLARDEAHLADILRLRALSMCQVPLPVQGAILGSLSVGTWKGSGRRHDDNDLKLLEKLGRQIALALDNARLLELSRRERARVDAAGRAKDEFLAVVSHELRTPLQAILGWARVLRREGLSEAQRSKAVEAIDRNATAQAALIQDLLDVTRIITGKLQLQVGPVELVQIAEAALDIVRPAAEAKGVRLDLWADPPVIPLVADGSRLQQILWNLLSNAVKFTERGGRVSLSISTPDESHATIVVRDTGKGIGAEFLPYIFDKFRQEDSGLTRRHGGLGLGLAIARHLVEGHGGTIVASSEGEDRGAEFTVSLPTRAGPASVSPVFKAAPHEQSGRAARAPPGDIRGLRVLVVDDERDARELVEELLGPSGASVLLAEGGEQALALIAAHRPDVVVSDIAMPGEDGYDWMRRLRQRKPEDGGRTPALALTAFARLEDRAQALLAGYEKHLSKPVEPGDLIAAIAELAGRK